jgi:hypothetical protein
MISPLFTPEPTEHLHRAVNYLLRASVAASLAIAASRVVRALAHRATRRRDRSTTRMSR